MITALFQYSIAVSIPLFILGVTYRWALAGEKQFALNRVVLLAIYGVSFVLAPALDWLNPATIANYSDSSSASMQPSIDLIRLLSNFWIAGAFCTLLFTVIEIVRIYVLVSRSEVAVKDGVTVYILDNKHIAPFSIGKRIVMSRQDFEKSSAAILAHENGHIHLHHSWDMIAAQAVAILCWYNPAAWLMRSELKSVHEYQADCQALNRGLNARDYQLLLIKKAAGSKFPSIGNNFNHSKLKKRIDMMNRSDSASFARKLLYLFPIGAIIIGILVLKSPKISTAITPCMSEYSKEQGIHNQLDDVEIFVDGEEISSQSLNDISSASIESITITKEKNHIIIRTKNDTTSE